MRLPLCSVAALLWFTFICSGLIAVVDVQLLCFMCVPPGCSLQHTSFVVVTGELLEACYVYYLCVYLVVGVAVYSIFTSFVYRWRGRSRATAQPRMQPKVPQTRLEHDQTRRREWFGTVGQHKHYTDLSRFIVQLSEYGRRCSAWPIDLKEHYTANTCAYVQFSGFYRYIHHLRGHNWESRAAEGHSRRQSYRRTGTLSKWFVDELCVAV